CNIAKEAVKAQKNKIAHTVEVSNALANSYEEVITMNSCASDTMTGRGEWLFELRPIAA
ncbi:hypothetical protein HKX48_000469, partial [Thoreauomyces humboldtii]